VRRFTESKFDFELNIRQVREPMRDRQRPVDTSPKGNIIEFVGASNSEVLGLKPNTAKAGWCGQVSKKAREPCETLSCFPGRRVDDQLIEAHQFACGLGGEEFGCARLHDFTIVKFRLA
jgi:hypothetical protein